VISATVNMSKERSSSVDSAFLHTFFYGVIDKANVNGTAESEIRRKRIMNQQIDFPTSSKVASSQISSSKVIPQRQDYLNIDETDSSYNVELKIRMPNSEHTCKEQFQNRLGSSRSSYNRIKRQDSSDINSADGLHSEQSLLLKGSKVNEDTVLLSESRSHLHSDNPASVAK
jgi:hypothetical protein